MDVGYVRAAGKPPRRLRAAPLHRGDKDEGLDEGYGDVTPPAGRTSRPFPIPSVEGWLRRAGVVSPAGRNPRPNPPKPPSLEGGAASAAGGASPQKTTLAIC
ncbi:MAG: hypothetical protein LBM98_13175 [Oscillospiraceae bacterium]|nr:hypothetical protein [Oscillospiraceae bacterium]